MVTGMKFSHMSKPDPICEPCLAGKMHANPFPTSQTRASKPLERSLHSPTNSLWIPQESRESPRNPGNGQGMDDEY